MVRNWPIVVALLAGLCVGVALNSRGPVQRAEARDANGTQNSEMASVKAEIQAIKDRLPDQAHAMQDVANQFTNVWFARAQSNWDLANFYFGETRNHLRWAVRMIPKRKDSTGHDVDLVSILQAFENGPLKQLEEAIKSKNEERFVAATASGTIFPLLTCGAAMNTPTISMSIDPVSIPVIASLIPL